MILYRREMLWLIWYDETVRFYNLDVQTLMHVPAVVLCQDIVKFKNERHIWLNVTLS